MTHSQTKKGIYFALWFLCILGTWSVLPYAHYLNIASSSASFVKIFLFSTIQAILFFGLVCWLSYLLVPKTDILPFLTNKPLKRIAYPGLIAGLSVGFIIYFLDITLFKSSQLAIFHTPPPIWTRLLGSFYGGINEEVLLRLFLFTFVFFLFRKIFKFESHNRTTFLWITNIIVAIIFGIGHLPALFKLTTPSSYEILRVILLNGIGGIIFGWLYWSRSLWTAMLAHFVADLVLHVFLI